MRSADDPTLREKHWSICSYFRIPTFAWIQNLTFALLLFLAGGCICTQGFGQPLQSDNQSNTVHGIVVNAVTHDPVGRALVFSGDNRYATLTDGEGHFEFTLTGRDATFLMIRKPGFLDDPNERRPIEYRPAPRLCSL